MDHRLTTIVGLQRVSELFERLHPSSCLCVERIGLCFVLPDDDCCVDAVLLVGDEIEPDKPGGTLQLGEEFALSWGAVPAAIFAARHPERVNRLVLYAPGFGAADAAAPAQQVERWAAMAALRRADLDLFARAFLMKRVPSGADEETFRSFVRIFRIAATPDMQDRLETVRCDRQSFLSEIRTPTLVLHRRDDHATAFAVGEQCAQQIPGARFVPLEGDAHFPWLGDWRSVVTPTLEFLLEDSPQID